MKSKAGLLEDSAAARQIEFPMRVAVCAWCKPKYWGGGPGAVTHGICPRHLRKLKLEAQRLSAQNTRPALLRVRLSRALKQSLEALAAAQRTDAAAIVRAACEQYVAQVRDDKPMLPLFGQPAALRR